MFDLVYNLNRSGKTEIRKISRKLDSGMGSIHTVGSGIGIYVFLNKNNDYIYVGQSRRLYTRISGHLSSSKKIVRYSNKVGILFDRSQSTKRLCRHYSVNNYSDLEKMLIYFYNPKYNREHYPQFLRSQSIESDLTYYKDSMPKRKKVDSPADDQEAILEVKTKWDRPITEEEKSILDQKYEEFLKEEKEGKTHLVHSVDEMMEQLNSDEDN